MNDWQERAFKLLAEGHHRKEIAYKLSAEGFRTSRGNEITANILSTFLSAERAKLKLREYLERLELRGN